MPIKTFKPYTPVRRFITVEDFSDITSNEPEKSLIAPIKKKGGRNNTGQIMVRHKGGGHKRHYRIIDFKRDKHNVVGTVATIEYDPNRSSRIALIEYADATHAFTNPDAGKTGKQFNMPIKYNAAADTASWNDMMKFLNGIFGS